jgi:predicted acetyltransferase
LRGAVRDPGDTIRGVTPPLQVQPLSAADEAEFFDVDQWAFGYTSQADDDEAARQLLEWDRVAGVRLGDPPRLAGISAALTLDLPVPGGNVPCGGLTWVGVHPEFRRRGILTAMMRFHFEALRERGELVSALHAAEAPIYGRFGYGAASSWLVLTIGRGAALRDVPGSADLVGRFETADLDRHGDLVADLYDRARAERPGWTSRPKNALREALFHLPESMRKEYDRQRLLTVRDTAGEVRAYALFLRKADWSETGPEYTVTVREAVALDAPAAHALWSRLIDLDLTSKIIVRRRPVDDALLNLLVDARGAGVRMIDGLWVRLVDLPGALGARRYQTPVDVVLDVRDDLVPANAGRWRVQGGADGARCERTDAEPDLALDVRDLGAAYLGGSTLAALVAAGLVTEHRPGALHPASVAFGWPVAPYSGWPF